MDSNGRWGIKRKKVEILAIQGVEIVKKLLKIV